LTYRINRYFGRGRRRGVPKNWKNPPEKASGVAKKLEEPASTAPARLLCILENYG